MTDGPPPRHLHPVTGTDEPPFDPDYDTPPTPRPTNDNRATPNDPNAERAILTTLLHDPDLGTHLATQLDTDDFYTPAHQQIWDTWHHLASTDGVPPDPITLNAHLTATKQTDLVRLLADLLTGHSTPTLATTYAAIVRDTARLRVVDQLSTGLRHIVATADVDQIDHYLAEALQRLDDTATRFGARPTHGTTTWAALDLTPVLQGQEVDPPPALLTRNDDQALLYTAAVHTVSGEPGSGKTWLTLIAALQQLDAGHDVTMIDFEDRASRVVGRLLALGAHPDTIRDHFRYVRPHTGLDATSQTDLEHATHGSTLVILDGVTEAMTLQGLDLNSNADVATFYSLLPRRLADTGATVVMIDHVVKDGEKQGRWALGGQHKLAGIDGVSYLVKALEPFGRGKTGRARITISKDRPGYIEEIALGRTAAELTLDARDVNCLRYDLNPPVAAPVDDAGNMRPTHLMERVSRWIELTPSAGRNQILDGVTGKATYLRRALDRLVQEGYIEVTTGRNRQQLHRSITPYREDEDAMHTTTGWTPQEPLT